MLLELCKICNIAHHDQYQCGSHSQAVLQAYTMMLQCVYSPKSVKNEHFSHFSRYLALNARAGVLHTLLKLCKTFNIAHHNQYQCGLHSQPVLQAYIMMLQCVYSPKSVENEHFSHLSDMLP